MMMTKCLVVALVLASFSCVVLSGSLPALNVNGISVSGLSAGAFMSVQFHIAFSKNIAGAGIIAGGPFYCAQGSMMKALTQCMGTAGMNVDQLVAFTKSLTDKDIDDLSFFKKQKLYLFSGTADTIVSQQVMRQLFNYYTKLGAESSNVFAKFDIPAQHAFITSDYGNACQYLGSPYISNCEYDSAGALLKYIHGDSLKPRVAPVEENLKKFSQSDYVLSGANMLHTGYIYVPTECQKNATCILHVSFHGCNQNTDSVGDAYVKHTGLNAWAEANNIIVLYPQADKSVLKNPNGCFDWFGYTNAKYYGKQGIQMQSVKNMIEAISGKSL